MLTLPKDMWFSIFTWIPKIKLFKLSTVCIAFHDNVKIYDERFVTTNKDLICNWISVTYLANVKLKDVYKLTGTTFVSSKPKKTFEGMIYDVSWCYSTIPTHYREYVFNIRCGYSMCTRLKRGRGFVVIARLSSLFHKAIDPSEHDNVATYGLRWTCRQDEGFVFFSDINVSTIWLYANETGDESILRKLKVICKIIK